MQVEQLGHPVQPGLLPAAHRMGLLDDVDAGAVGGRQAVHDDFHARVGDDGDRVTG
jgi:hypothetical protein